MRVVFSINHYDKYEAFNVKSFIQFVNKAQLSVWFWDVKKHNFTFLSDQLLDKVEKAAGSTMSRNEVIRLFEKHGSIDMKNIARELAQDREACYPHCISLSNGHSIWLDTKMIGIKDKDNRLVLIIGFIKDEQEAGLIQDNNTMISNDSFTGLPNLSDGWKAIERLINQSGQKKKKFALVKVVVSNFPNILITFGNDIAHQVLYEVSHRLTKYMDNKGLAFHSYTDGWYLVFYSVRNIEKVVEKMMGILQNPINIDDEKVHLIINVGMTRYPDHGINVEELMKHTMIATLSAVKHGPGGKDIYTEEENIALLKKAQLRQDLFECIQKNELYLEYQPKVCVKSLAVTGAEALIRWQHPIWGNVSPAEFIPLIKEIGLEENLTLFVIDEAVKQLKQWQKAGISSPNLSINLSPECLLLPGLYSYLKSILKKYKVSPKQLEIEITEDVKLKYNATILNTLAKIQDLGINIALDDMGEGFSSLYDLVNYKIDTLKIDRRAIDELENCNSQRTIIKGLLDICDELGIKTVVEGVERKAQFDVLKEMDCDEIQGFYFSPSISSQEMEKWFQMSYAVPSTQSDVRQIEHRKYFCVKLPHSLYAEMRILTIRDKEINLERDTVILVQNIGPGGLMFYSYLQLPVNDLIIYQFEMDILGSQFSFAGKIVWHNEHRKGIYAHGVEFQINEAERERLTSALFKLSALVRDKPTYTDNSILEDDPVLYLRKLNVKRKV